MDEFNPRKWAFILALLFGAGWYARTHWSPYHAVRWARKHPESAVAPAIQYYAGTLYYMKSRYPEAIRAFEDLASAHPDSPYATEAHFRMANSYSEMRNWGPARDAYARYIADQRGRHRATAERKLEAIKYR